MDRVRTFKGIGGVKVDGGFLVDCQVRGANVRRRGRSVVLGDFSSDHLLAVRQVCTRNG